MVFRFGTNVADPHGDQVLRWSLSRWNPRSPLHFCDGIATTSAADGAQSVFQLGIRDRNFKRYSYVDLILFKGVARLLMTVLCMIFPEWRAASIACAITALPALIILIFVFPESPTWLHNKVR